jgi:succinate dehydrogenase / fumarate reductase membrane anchor subunit
MSMKTELAKVRGLGAAHDGTHHFWMQRVTAIANLPLVTYLVYFIVAHLGATREAVVASIKNPFAAVALVLAMISICWHMKLGLQMVIEDYVHGTATKLVALLLNAFFAYGLAGLAIYAILKMNFGV